MRLLVSEGVTEMFVQKMLTVDKISGLPPGAALSLPPHPHEPYVVGDKINYNSGIG